MIFMAIGIGFLYFVTNFIGGIQEEDEKYQNKDYQQEHKYDKYNSVDSIGQETLDFTGVDSATQSAAWQGSRLRQEFLTFFPDFSAMKYFIKDRIRGDSFQKKMLRSIGTIEGKYFSGAITSEQAKKELDLLK